MTKALPYDPSYYEALPEVLLSDAYWQPLADTKVTYAHAVPNKIDAVQKIATVVQSLANEATVTPLQPGDDLPTTHDRQVIRVIEDTRHLISKFNLSQALHRHALAKHDHKFEQEMNQFTPGFELPTFSEMAMDIDKERLLYPASAHTFATYSLSKVASLQRKVMYLQYDEQRDEYIGAHASLLDDPEHWETAIEAVPKMQIGTAYQQLATPNAWLGKIVSAELCEATGVIFPAVPPKKKTPRKPKNEKAAKLALPGFAPLPAAS